MLVLSIVRPMASNHTGHLSISLFLNGPWMRMSILYWSILINEIWKNIELTQLSVTIKSLFNLLNFSLTLFNDTLMDSSGLPCIMLCCLIKSPWEITSTEEGQIWMSTIFWKSTGSYWQPRVKLQTCIIILLLWTILQQTVNFAHRCIRTLPSWETQLVRLC